MSSIHSGKHTPTFAPPPDAKTSEAKGKTESSETTRSAEHAPKDQFKSEPDAHKAALPVPALTTPRPASPAKMNQQESGEPNLYRSSSARPAARATSPAPDSLRSVKSEPASGVKTKAPGPREFQEHFYELGSVVVDPRYHADAAALAKVIDRKEGLKIYMHEAPDGRLYAISHAASEANLPEGQSTQHMQLQYAVMIYGAMRGAGRFAVDDKQKMASKQYARSVINNADPKAHGGLRLQKHEGKHVIDVSGTFSFHGASDASMEHIARFYATVLRHAEPPGEQVEVIPADASCNQKFALQAQPHLQDLARRINDILED